MLQLFLVIYFNFWIGLSKERNPKNLVMEKINILQDGVIIR